MRGTIFAAGDEGSGAKAGVNGDGRGDVMSSGRGVSLIPIIMCAGERVGWISAPAWMVVVRMRGEVEKHNDVQ